MSLKINVTSVEIRRVWRPTHADTCHLGMIQNNFSITEVCLKEINHCRSRVGSGTILHKLWTIQFIFKLAVWQRFFSKYQYSGMSVSPVKKVLRCLYWIVQLKSFSDCNGSSCVRHRYSKFSIPNSQVLFTFKTLEIEWPSS